MPVLSNLDRMLFGCCWYDDDHLIDEMDEFRWFIVAANNIKIDKFCSILLIASNILLANNMC
jgi:hypothetical protein